MGGLIKESSFLGQPSVQADNGELELVVVPGWGSNAVQLKVHHPDVQLLRTPTSVEAYESKPVLYGMPVLFPPNRIADGVFRYGDRTYQFRVDETALNNHIHGFAYREAWVLCDAKEENGRVIVETEFKSTDHPEVMRQFPHPLSIRLRFELDGLSLILSSIITNEGDAAFPWGLGFHTTFNFPFRPGDDPNRCRFALSVDKQWELNDRLLPTGAVAETAVVKDLREGLNLSGRAFDDAFLSSVAAGGPNEAVLVDDNLGLRVVYGCDSNFLHWVLYTGDGHRGFVCPEPYTWVTNAPNLDMPASLTGVQVLQPGQQRIMRTEISVARER